MSTRQYVGARYVPKFSDPIAWDKNRGYEALEIVTYLGTSYTSKKPVPVGTDIGNEEFWVVTGNYNAQVEQYRQETQQYKKSIRTVINVKENGFDNTGSTDCAILFNDLYLKNPHGTFFFPAGTYLFNSGVILDHHCEIMLDESAKIICGEPSEYLFYLAPSNTQEDYNDVFGMKRYIISGGTIDCNEKVKTCILAEYTYASHIYDVKIKNFITCGIHIKKGAGLLVENCVLWGKQGNSDFGYKNDGFDGRVTCTSVVNCNVGYRSNDDFISKSTAWIDENGTYSGTVCFYDGTHSTYTECVSDTYETSWKGTSNSTSNIVNCNVINNNNVATPSENTIIFDSEAISRFKYYNVLVILNNFTFSKLDLSRFSGINFNDALRSGKNVPKLTDFNSIIIPVENTNNITKETLNSYTKSCNINAFFSANAIKDYGNVWGRLEVTSTSTAIVQTAFMCGYPVFTRNSVDNGLNWSNWTSNFNIAERRKTNLTSVILDTITEPISTLAYFETNSVANNVKGWGHLNVYHSDPIVAQIVNISGLGCKSRVSEDNGTSWSNWS